MTTSFSQTGGEMKSTWTDFRFTYRIKWFQPVLAVGHCEIQGKRTEPVEEEAVDTTCITAGAGLDFKYDVSKTLVAHFDSLFMSSSNSRDADGRDIAIGTRTDFEAGVTFHLPLEGLGVLTGYRLRTFSIDLGFENPKLEMQTGPIFGLGYGLTL